MKLKVVIELGEQGGFIGGVPALPERRSQGATRDEPLTNLKEAAEGWLEAEQEKDTL